MAKKLRDCETCGGTGWQWLLRSWFPADGMRRSRCGICSGTGKSNYRHWMRDFVAHQAAWRAERDQSNG